MELTDKNIIVVCTLFDDPINYTIGFKGYCFNCFRELYVSDSSINKMKAIPGGLALMRTSCAKCCIELMKKEDSFGFIPPSQEQIDEVNRFKDQI